MKYKFTLNDEDILQAIGDYVSRMRKIPITKATIQVSWKMDNGKIISCNGEIITLDEGKNEHIR